MIDQQQAEILHDLVVRALGFDARGNIIAVPPGFDLAEVADALAGVEAEKNGDSVRPLVIEFLARLGPDLVAATVDASGTPSAARLERYVDGAAELLTELGETSGHRPRRMTVRRCGVDLDLPGWLPIEVFDSLARIAGALSVQVATAPALAGEAEVQAAMGRSARAIIEETAKLLAAIDPDFDGVVTPTAVEVAARRVANGDSPASASTRPDVVAHELRNIAVIVGHHMKDKPQAAERLHALADRFAAEATARAGEYVPAAANDPGPRVRDAVAERRGHRVCTVERAVYGVTVLGQAAGATLSSSELDVMSLGEERVLPGGATIVRTSAGWELWRDEVSRG